MEGVAKLDPVPGIEEVDLAESARLGRELLPFMRGQVLYIAGAGDHWPGDEAFLLADLGGDAGKRALCAKVVWVAPQGADSTWPPGIGACLDPEELECAEIIRSLLDAQKQPAAGR